MYQRTFIPPSDHLRSTLLIAGSAPCLYDDLEKAKKLRPNHYVMAINDAARWVPCDLIFSIHPEKMASWSADQRIFNSKFTTHSALEFEVQRVKYPAVDYWWLGVISSATSAWSGALLAYSMGFPEIILCGCPMNGGDGYAGDTEKGSPSNPRFGYKSPESGLIKSFKDSVALNAQKAITMHVFSMSGYTQEKFGAPPKAGHYGKQSRDM